MQKCVGSKISSTKKQLHVRLREKTVKLTSHTTSLGGNVDDGATNKGRKQKWESVKWQGDELSSGHTVLVECSVMCSKHANTMVAHIFLVILNLPSS